MTTKDSSPRFRTQFQLYIAIFLSTLIAATPLFGGLPSGGSFVSGSGEMATSGMELTVTQDVDRAIIDWTSFSIGDGFSTQFVQPSSTSAVLNRVTGGSASELHGSLSANGQVFLINPNGILVGASGVVDTASFVASTLDVTNAGFLAGGELTFSGTSDAAVVNLGAITATGGDIFLIAQRIENAGSLTAAKGEVGLGAGTEVLLLSDGEDGIFVSGGAGIADATGIANSGTIDALTANLMARGNLYSLAVNNTGSITASAVEEHAGRVRLVANGGWVKTDGVVVSESTASDDGYTEISGEFFSVHGRVSSGGGQTVISYLQPDVAIRPLLTLLGGAGTVTIQAGSDNTGSSIGADTITGLLDDPEDVQIRAETLIQIVDPITTAGTGTLTFDDISDNGLTIALQHTISTGGTVTGDASVVEVSVNGVLADAINLITNGGEIDVSGLGATTVNLADIGNAGTITGAASATLVGFNETTTWALDSTPTVTSTLIPTATDTVNFSGFGTLSGGSGADTFRFSDGVSFDVDGNGGTDVLDLTTNFTATVTIDNLSVGATDGFDGEATDSILFSTFADINDILVDSGGTFDGSALAGTYNFDASGSTFTSGGSISIDGFTTFTGSTGVDTFTVDYGNGDPFGGSNVTINAGDGADVFNFNRNGGALAAGQTFFFNGGAGADAIGTGSADGIEGTFTTVTHTFENASDGEIALTSGNSVIIDYEGLAPVFDNASATNRVFTFTGGAETIELTDGAGAGDGISQIDSTLGESVTFADPSASMTINAGTGNDTITFTALDSTFDAAITVNGDDGTDTINAITGTTALPANIDSITFNAETINLDDLTTDGTQSYNGAVTLSTSSATFTTTDSVISFTSTLDGNNQDLILNSGTAATTITGAVTNLGDGTGAALTVNSTGTTTFSSTIGAANGFTSVDASTVTFSDDVTITGAGTATTLNGDVNLAGLTFTSAGVIELGNAAADTVTLSAGDVSIVTTGAGDNLIVDAAVTGPRDLTLDVAGTTDFNSTLAVGDGTGASLIVNSDGATDFNDTVTLNDGITATAHGLITFFDDVDINGSNVGTTFSDSVTFDATAATGGTLDFVSDGAITLGDAAADTITLSGGPLNLNNDTGNGAITANGAFASGGQNVTVDAGAGGDITFGSTYTGGGILTVTDGDAVDFQDAVNVASITVTDATTSLEFDSTLTTTAGAVMLTSGGTITTTGAVSATTTVEMDAGGLIDIGDIAATNIDIDSGATGIDLNGDTYTASTDDVIFRDIVDLDAPAGNITVTAGGAANDDITFSGAVRDANNNNTLILNGTGGTITISGDAGNNNGNRLGALTIAAAAQVDVADIRANGAIAITATNIDLNADTYISSTDAITFTGAVDLDSSGGIAIDTGGGAGDDVTFTSTITDTGSNSDLTIFGATAGSAGDVSIAGDTGTLNSFTIAGATTVDVADILTDAGDIDITATTIDLNDATYTAGDDILLTGAVNLESAGTLTLTSGGAGGDTITVTGAVEDAAAAQSDTDLVIVGGSGSVNLQSAVGGTNPVNSFNINTAGQVDVANIFADDEIDIGATSAVTNIDLNGTTYTSTGTTAGTDVRFNGPVDLDAGAATVSITSGGGAGEDIIFTSTISDPTPATVTNLSLTAAAGNVSVQGAAGPANATRLGAFTVVSAAVVDVEDIRTTNAIDITATTRVDLNDNVYNSQDGDITFTVPNLELDFDGAISMDSDSDGDATDGNITITGTITDVVQGDAVAGNDQLTLSADTGSIDLQGDVGLIDSLTVVDAGVIDLENVTVVDVLSVTADDIDLNANTYTSQDGNITFTGPVDLDVAGGTVTVDSDANDDGTDGSILFTAAIDDADDDTALVLTASTGQIQVQGDIGQASGGTDTPVSVTIQDATLVEVADILAEDAINIGSASAITLIRLFGDTYTSSGDTAGSDITFNGPVQLSQNGTVTITSGGDDGEDIFFNDTVNGAAANDNLTVNAGALGDVTFTGAVGNANRLDDIVITNATTVDFDSTVTAESIRQVAGAGTTTFDGDIDLDGTGANGIGLELNGNDFVFADTITTVTTTNSANSVLIDITDVANDPDLDIGILTFELSGSFEQNSSGGDATVEIAGDIETNGGFVNFEDAVTLTDDETISIDTTETLATGADITFQSTVDATTAASENLTLNAGTGGDVTFIDAVGAGTAPGDIVITSADDVDFDSTVEAETLTQTAGFGTTTFDDSVLLNNGGAAVLGLDLNTVNVTLSTISDIVVTDGGAEITIGVQTVGAGTLTIPGGAGDGDIVVADTFTQNVGLNASGSVLIGGDIVTSGGAISIASPITLTAAADDAEDDDGDAAGDGTNDIVFTTNNSTANPTTAIFNLDGSGAGDNDRTQAGDITLLGTIDGAEQLIIEAGGGTVSFGDETATNFASAEAIGGVTPLRDLRIFTTGDLFTPTINTDRGTGPLAAALGRVRIGLPDDPTNGDNPNIYDEASGLAADPLTGQDLVVNVAPVANLSPSSLTLLGDITTRGDSLVGSDIILAADGPLDFSAVTLDVATELGGISSGRVGVVGDPITLGDIDMSNVNLANPENLLIDFQTNAGNPVQLTDDIRLISGGADIRLIADQQIDYEGAELISWTDLSGDGDIDIISTDNTININEPIETRGDLTLTLDTDIDDDGVTSGTGGTIFVNASIFTRGDGNSIAIDIDSDSGIRLTDGRMTTQGSDVTLEAEDSIIKSNNIQTGGGDVIVRDFDESGSFGAVTFQSGDVETSGGDFLIDEAVDTVANAAPVRAAQVTILDSIFTAGGTATVESVGNVFFGGSGRIRSDAGALTIDSSSGAAIFDGDPAGTLVAADADIDIDAVGITVTEEIRTDGSGTIALDSDNGTISLIENAVLRAASGAISVTTTTSGSILIDGDSEGTIVTADANITVDSVDGVSILSGMQVETDGGDILVDANGGSLRIGGVGQSTNIAIRTDEGNAGTGGSITLIGQGVFIGGTAGGFSSPITIEARGGNGLLDIDAENGTDIIIRGGAATGASVTLLGEDDTVLTATGANADIVVLGGTATGAFAAITNTSAGSSLIDLDATGNIIFGNQTAGAFIGNSAGRVGTLNGGHTSIDIDATNIILPNSIHLGATTGTGTLSINPTAQLILGTSAQPVKITSGLGAVTIDSDDTGSAFLGVDSSGGLIDISGFSRVAFTEASSIAGGTLDVDTTGTSGITLSAPMVLGSSVTADFAAGSTGDIRVEGLAFISAADDVTLALTATGDAVSIFGINNVFRGTPDSLTVSADTIDLERPIAFGGATDVSFTSTGNLSITATIFGGAISTGGGNITLDSGAALTVAGTALSLSSQSGEISLEADDTVTIEGGVRAFGTNRDITIVADADDDDTGILTVTSLVRTNGGNISLTTGTNTNGGNTVTLSGSSLIAGDGDITITADGDLALGGIETTGSVTLLATDSAITQDASGLTVGDFFSITGGSVDLDTTPNSLGDFSLTTTTGAGAVAVSGDLEVDNSINVATDLSLTATGDITLDLSTFTVGDGAAGTLSFITGDSFDINIEGTVTGLGDNAGDSIAFTGGNVTWENASPETGDLSLGASEVANTLSITGSDDNIVQTAPIEVGTLIVETSGDVTLTESANSIRNLSIEAANGNITTSGALRLDVVDVTTNLTLTTSGLLDQTATGLTFRVAGILALDTGGAAVSFGNARGINRLATLDFGGVGSTIIDATANTGTLTIAAAADGDIASLNLDVTGSVDVSAGVVVTNNAVVDTIGGNVVTPTSLTSTSGTVTINGTLQ